MIGAMSNLDSAVSDILARLRGSNASIEAIAQAAGGLGVATVWALKSAESADNAAVTLKTLRRIDQALRSIESGIAPDCGGPHA
jgi:hypothetical protein